MKLNEGEARLIVKEWAQEAERASATLSVSAWEYDGSATLSGESTSGTSASVLFTPTSCGVLTNTATLSDGQVFIEQWEVEVNEW